MTRLLLTLLALSTFCCSAQAPATGVLGRWTEPGGSTIQVAPCAGGVCAQLISIDRQAPAQVDSHNPDPALRSRALCGLQIGSHFHLADPNHADGGALYDPRSGKTYTGAMTSVGDKLKLRGYVGIKLFGRSETWTRAAPNAATCHP